MRMGFAHVMPQLSMGIGYIANVVCNVNFYYQIPDLLQFTVVFNLLICIRLFLPLLPHTCSSPRRVCPSTSTSTRSFLPLHLLAHFLFYVFSSSTFPFYLLSTFCLVLTSIFSDFFLLSSVFPLNSIFLLSCIFFFCAFVIYWSERNSL